MKEFSIGTDKKKSNWIVSELVKRIVFDLLIKEAQFWASFQSYALVTVPT